MDGSLIHAWMDGYLDDGWKGERINGWMDG